MKIKLISIKVKSYLISKIKDLRDGGYTWVGKSKNSMDNE